ncbi:hypothetical protein Pf1_02390 [Flavobacterium columnare]|uniref:hypothetical protein n=1 Tax=Flavobacterium columnare TaxID=996 RepID=UPI0007F98710|nr:hypothetical protein [Flavobacterium columnare]ANO47844.1 hypothetical protein Pf1_02390 [Flavobacterium columnare]APT21561.1 hypothetical protein BU993_02260 [Flavobacterium columnare]
MKKQIKELNHNLTQNVNFSSYGFSLYEEDEVDFAYKYQRKENDKIDKITYSFEKDKWREKSSLSSIGFGIVFPIINTIIENIEFEEKFYSPKDEYTVIQIPNYDKKVDYYSNLIGSTSIIENKEINFQHYEYVKSEFINQLKENVLPFFSKFQSLQDINDKILEKEEFSNYYKYIFGETGAKVLIIMKLCNSNKYQEYKKWSDNIIAKQIADPMYEDYKDILINQQATMDKLYNYLESGAYKNLLKE